MKKINSTKIILEKIDKNNMGKHCSKKKSCGEIM
jgi:hypothetical protein